jgi:hypothetical protein
VDFTGSSFGTCTFENCTFKNTIFRKCEFWERSFQNCQILGCDLTRADFYRNVFRNCQFQKVDLEGNCEFTETMFEKIRLKNIVVVDLNFWKSNECIKVKDSSSFEKLLRDMNSISTDRMDNSEGSLNYISERNRCYWISYRGKKNFLKNQ